jgi:gliding motility-associated-like protein
MYFKKYILLLLVVYLCAFTSFAQLTVTPPGQTALDFAQVIAGPGITVSNANFVGDPMAIGEFGSGINDPGLGIPSGVVMASGSVVDVAGLNGDFASTIIGSAGEPYLAALAGEISNDAIVLEFDFVPNADFVSFKYVFGSEEYPEWVCSAFNDMFAFTIAGVTVPLPETNIALIPGTGIGVGINTINDDPLCGGDFSAFYVDNTIGTASQYCVYDGLTTVLIAESQVICGETYRLRLMLSDGGDSSFDSGCFIEENSLTTGNVTIETASIGGDTMAIEGCGDITVQLTLNGDAPAQDLLVPLWLGGWTAEWGIDYDPISAINLADSTITIPAGSNNVSFTISPINDNIPEGLEYLDLIAITSTCGTLDTLRLYINDLVPLTLNMPNDTVICTGNAVLIAQGLGGGGDYTYDWTGFGVVDTIFPAPVVSTWYYCTITDECGSTSATDSVQVIVDGGPEANAGFDITVCIGGSISLNGSSTTPNVTYEWDLPLYLDDPLVSNPTCTPAAAISYQLTVTRDDGCWNIDSVDVTLSDPPTSDFNLPALGCLGEPMIIDYTGNSDQAGSYNWNFGSGTQLNGTGSGPYSVSWENAGIQNVTLSVYWNGCTSAPLVQQIEIIGPPVIDAGIPVSICSGDAGVLGVLGNPAYNYAWSPIIGLDDPTSATANVTLTNFTSDHLTTLYYLTASDQGCISTDSVEVTVFATPTAQFSVPDGECFKTNSFDLTALGFFGPTASFDWDFGVDGFPSNSDDANPNGVIFNTFGNQSVTLIVTDNECVSAPYIASIEVYPMPDANFISEDLEGCQPYAAKFRNVSIGHGSFLYESWDFGDGETASQHDPTHTYMDDGAFTVNLLVTSTEGCKDSISFSNYVQVHPKPDAFFAASPKLMTVLDPTTHVESKALGTILSCEYYIEPEGLPIYNCDFDYTFEDTLTYTITQYVTTDLGCLDTISDEVKVRPIYTMYIPTGFTPDEDGINETWRPISEGMKEYKVWILDRWGSEIWYSANPEESWDGTLKGKLLPAGVYTYRVETWDVLGEPHEYTGWFHLFK